MTESRYTLHLGDCLEVMRDMEAGSVDAIITDLPYGTTACSWDEVIPFEPMWEAVRHVLKPKGVFVTTASQPFTSKLVMSNLDWFRHSWVWEKNKATNIFMATYAPMKKHEDVLVFGTSVNVFNAIKVKRSEAGKNRAKYVHNPSNTGKREYLGGFEQTESIKYDENLKNPESIIYFNNEVGLHPTQKPIALYEYLIRTYTNAGDTVLDCTAGSGTTGVAAMRTGRKFIGVELDPTYFAIAEERIANAAGEIVVTAKERERGMVSLFDWAGQD